MMIKTAGGPGMVSPIDYGERKSPGLSRTGWIAIGVVAAAHIGVGVALYNQRFEIDTIPTPATEPVSTVTLERILRPEPVKPANRPVVPPPPNLPHHQTDAPTQPTDTLAAVPGDRPTDSTTVTIGTAVETPVEDGPVAETPRPPAVITNPSWSRQPSADQMMRAYPERAIAASVSGSASLNCLVLPNGAVSDCTVTRESPGGYGFGRAALGLSRHFRVNPRTVNGAAEGSRVNIGLRFNLPED